MTQSEENLRVWRVASCVCKSGVTGRRQRPNPNIPCCISTCKSCSLSTAMPQVYEYFLYCDTLNFIRELCKVFRDLQITGIVGVTVLCYTVPRVFMLVKLACGHSLRDKKVFLSCLWHPFPYKKCACVTEQKSLCFHKAITSKHCCCAENFNRSCICTIF